MFLKRQLRKKEKYYMNIDDVIEWFGIANDDFDSKVMLIFPLMPLKK
jgi:hypothetical protein